MPRTCVRCHEPFVLTATEQYLHEAMGEPLPERCRLCRLLSKGHHIEEASVKTRDTRLPSGQRPVAQTRKPLPVQSPHRHTWTPAEACAAFQRWRTEHHRFPTREDMDIRRDIRTASLPTSRVVRQLFGSLTAAHAAFLLSYGGAPPRQRSYTVSSIHADVCAWTARHGRVPMTPDFETDTTLPSPATVRRYCGTLARLYATLDAARLPGAAHQYAAQLHAARSAAVKQGHRARRSSYQALKFQHRCVDCGQPALCVQGQWRARCQRCLGTVAAHSRRAHQRRRQVARHPQRQEVA